MNSATSNLSLPSKQHPIKFAKRLLLSCPTALASACNQTQQHIYSHIPELYKAKIENLANFIRTRNWLQSGQSDWLKRLTATKRPSSSFPLYTTLEAPSPPSETTFPNKNPKVAAFSWSKLNSVKLGNESFSFWLPFSAYYKSRVKTFSGM